MQGVSISSAHASAAGEGTGEVPPGGQQACGGDQLNGNALIPHHLQAAAAIHHPCGAVWTALSSFTDILTQPRMSVLCNHAGTAAQQQQVSGCR